MPDNQIEIVGSQKNEKLELYDKSINHIYDKSNILVKTELSGKEIQLIAYGQFMADRCNAPIIKEYIKNILEGKLSLKRQSRKEAIEVSKALLQSQTPEVEPKTFGEHLIGKRQY